MRTKKGILLAFVGQFSIIQIGFAQTVPTAGTPGGALPKLTRPLIVDQPVEQEPLKPEKKEAPSAKGEKLQPIPVKGFKFDNLQDYPELGITKKKITMLADQMRQTLSKGKKGLTLVDLHHIANALTLYYRQAGLILAVVYLPPQKIGKDYIVMFHIEPGRLGTLTFEGNRWFSNKLLAWPFQSLKSKPVEARSMESALLTINSYSGYQGGGIFKRGAAPGTSDLVIKTTKETLGQFTFGLDDSGTVSTGRNHYIYLLAANDLFGGADRLTLMRIQNARPSRGYYSGLSYARRVFLPNLEAGASYGENKYTLGGVFKDLQFRGVSRTGSAHLKNTWVRTRQTTWSGTLKLSRKQSKTRYSGVDQTRDNLTILGVHTNVSHIFSRIHGYAELDLGLEHGFNNFLGAMDGDYGANTVKPGRRSSLGPYASGLFNKAVVDATYLQQLFWAQQLYLKFQGQYSHNLLSSLEQFDFGGVNNVRAFAASSYLVDKAAYGSAAWTIPTPFIYRQHAFSKYSWGQIIRWSAFADFAHGSLNHPVATDTKYVTISGYGAGVSFNIPNYFKFELQYARPFGFSRLKPADGRSGRFWFVMYVSLPLDA